MRAPSPLRWIVASLLAMTLLVTAAAGAEGAPRKVTLEATGPNGAQVSLRRLKVSTCMPALHRQLSLGTHKLKCKLASGAARSLTVIVRDSHPPLLIAPSSVVVDPDTDLIVAYQVKAIDAVDRKPIVSCSVHAGQVAPDTDQFTCTAKDHSANRRQAHIHLMRSSDAIDSTQDSPDLGQVGASSTLPAPSPIAVPLQLHVPGDIERTVTETGGHVSVSWHISLTGDGSSDLASQAACLPASGSSFTVGAHQITCRLDHENTRLQESFAINVRIGSLALVSGGSSLSIQAHGQISTASGEGWTMADDPGSVSLQEDGSFVSEHSNWHTQAQWTSNHAWKENVVVESRQGQRTWTWHLDGASPHLDANGWVMFGSASIAPAVILDAQNAVIARPAWSLNGADLSLSINDSSFSLPYVIDPTVMWTTITMTSGPTDRSYTQSASPLFVWTLSGATPTSVVCVWDNAIPVPCAGSSQKTNWTEGFHTFSVRAIMPYGMTESAVAWVIDRIPPEPFTLSIPTVGSRAVLSVDEWEPACVDYIPSVIGPSWAANWGHSLQDPGGINSSGVDRLEVRVDGVLQDTLDPSSVGWQRDESAIPASMTVHTLRIEAIDRAGNRSVAPMIQLRQDIAPPTLTVGAPAIGASVTSPVNFTWTAGDDVCLRKVTLQIDGVIYQLSGERSDYSVNLSKGIHQWRMLDTDNAGQSTNAWTWRSITVV